MSDKLEYSCNQVKDAEAEKTQVKLHIEEMERSARDEMNKLQETNQQEITNMRNFNSIQSYIFKYSNLT